MLKLKHGFKRQKQDSGRTFKLGASAEGQSASTSGARSNCVTKELQFAFRALQNPAVANKRYDQALRDFTSTAILAYECGYSEYGIRQILKQPTASDIATDTTNDTANDTSDTSKDDSQLQADTQQCLVCMSIVWITVGLAPGEIMRWSKGAAVSDDTLSIWKGFVSMIVSAYFEKRWAWYPINRLQLELAAVSGKAERPEDVAEWARLVYTTLETTSPQFPKM